MCTKGIPQAFDSFYGGFNRKPKKLALMGNLQLLAYMVLGLRKLPCLTQTSESKMITFSRCRLSFRSSNTVVEEVNSSSACD